MMLSAKNQMLKIIQEQPENRSHKDILRKDAFATRHELADSLRTLSDDLEHIQDVKEMIQLFRSGEHGDISFERIR
jgi:hypothetical protein